VSREGLYGLKIHPSGRLESILLDEKIPWSSDFEKGPLILAPSNTPENIKDPNVKRKRQLELETDLWPHLVAKGLAKALGCYERLFNQKLENSLSDITGMPIRTYSTEEAELPFAWLRESFKRGFILIGKAKQKWRSKMMSAHKNVESQALDYWTVGQIVKLNDEEELVELKNHLCPNPAPPEWRTDQFVKISDDWMKYRRYKRRDRSGYWIKYGELREFFDSVVVCKYRDDYQALWKSTESKHDGPILSEFCVSETTTATITFIQPDEVCCASDHQYSKLRTFLLQIPESNKENPNPLPVMVKAAYNNPGKVVFVDAKLEPGTYRLLADLDSPPSEFGVTMNIRVFTDLPISWNLCFTGESHRFHKDFLSTLAIQRGTRTDLVDGGALRRYHLDAPKLGMNIVTYANRGTCFYSIGERYSEFRAKCNKSLEDGNILAMHIPPNARKSVVLRTLPSLPVTLKISEGVYTEKR
jgi:Calpain family cysteine protease